LQYAIRHPTKDWNMPRKSAASKAATAAPAAPPAETDIRHEHDGNQPNIEPLPNGQQRPSLDDIINKLHLATPGQMARFFVSLTTERDKHQRMVDVMNGYRERVQEIILHAMKELDQEGFRTDTHTVYSYELKTFVVVDKEEFKSYCLEIDDGLDLCNFMPVKEACQTFLEKYKEPPEGLKQNIFPKLGVRKL